MNARDADFTQRKKAKRWRQENERLGSRATQNLRPNSKFASIASSHPLLLGMLNGPRNLEYPNAEQ
jgi:hypothetical protein